MKRRLIEVVLVVAVCAASIWCYRLFSPSSLPNTEGFQLEGQKLLVDGIQLGEKRAVVDAKLGAPIRLEALPQKSFEVCFYQTGALVCLVDGRCIEVVGTELSQDGKLVLTKCHGSDEMSHPSDRSI